MSHYTVTCNTKNLITLVEDTEPPTSCPVDGCENFSIVEER